MTRKEAIEVMKAAGFNYVETYEGWVPFDEWNHQLSQFFDFVPFPDRKTIEEREQPSFKLPGAARRKRSTAKVHATGRSFSYLP